MIDLLLPCIQGLSSLWFLCCSHACFRMSAPLRRVAVVGTGIVGKSWAIVFARAGCEVAIYDSLPKAAEDAIPIIRKLATDLHQAGLLGICSSVEEAMGRIRVASSLEDALKDVTWVQECVPEKVEMKEGVFKELDLLAPVSAVLGSSTSAIPASAFTHSIKTRERCLIAHPVNPPHVIPLVELVPAPYTLPSVVADAREFMEKIGQSPVVVKKEVDSFVLNRLQGALLNEAFKLVEDGVVSVEDLDRTVKDGLGLRWSFIGPFETIDMNAPGGTADYISRYGNNMYLLAQQQAQPRPWSEAVSKAVTEQRRALLPVDKLPERIEWRNKRLMALVAHKKQQDKADQQKK